MCGTAGGVQGQGRDKGHPWGVVEFEEKNSKDFVKDGVKKEEVVVRSTLLFFFRKLYILYVK